MNIAEKLSKIQAELKVKKSRYNSFGKYNFRSAEDILESLKPFNLKYKVAFTISENLIEDSVLEVKASIIDVEKTESLVSTAIVGIDMEQKGMQMPQRFGAASSYGKKYALGNLLLIDDSADADATNDHGKAEKPETKDKKNNKLSAPRFVTALEALKKDKTNKSVLDHLKDFALTDIQKKQLKEIGVTL